MKLGFLSDIHINDAAKFQSLTSIRRSFVSLLLQSDIDTLIISGDISSDWQMSLEFCEYIQEQTNITVYAVPGNHEYWLEDLDTAKAIEAFNAHPMMLTNQFVQLTDDWSLYGGIGWYDYSFRTPESTPELVGQKKKDFWPDADFVDFSMPDPVFLNKQLEQWKKDFASNSSKNVIFAQHFVPDKKFLVYKENNPNWNFCSAYLGSSKIGDFIQAHPEIKISPFGHTHKRFGEVTLGNTEFICNPVGYKNEWNTDDYEQELFACLTIKEI